MECWLGDIMKSKKKIIIPIIALIISIIGLIVYFVLTTKDKVTTLTIMDRQWIEANKNKLVDIEITADVPNFNYNGEGVFFDFLASFEKNVGIEFNRVAIRDNSEKLYAFRIVDKASKNDIFIYRDNYAIVSSNDNTRYSDISKIKDMTIGVTEDEYENATKYLIGSQNITLKSYKTVSDMIEEITDSTEETHEVDAILILKNNNLYDIIKNNLYINYNLSDYNKDYVLTLGDNDKLNSIIKKYYKKWKSENYEKSFNSNFSNTYFLASGIAERERVDFVSKRYSYGFVDETPYNVLVDESLNGFNAIVLRNFSKLANIEISFEKFDNYDSLLNKFNAQKLDFIFNNYSNYNYNIDVVDTMSVYNEKVAFISKINNNLVINSIYSLAPYKVSTIKGSKISNYLKNNNIEIKEYNNISDLISSIDDNSIIAINKDTYNYYMHTVLNQYKIDYEEYLNDEYNFVINYSSENEVFTSFFEFYLSFIDEKSIMNDAYSKLVVVKSRKTIITKIVLYVLAIVGAITLVRKFIDLLLIRRRKKNNLSKEHKLKYVDMLTSLKNRNYLNDNIEKWDSSEVYPQTIVVIDLNNVAYINDNYGHQEGDNLIKEAANVLIKTQVSNTDIIRTNGNEFLIYMVGYDEKQVIAYIRRLNREFKELAHGFGAAIGYSIINDAIKTIDDAVNEATLDMRNNKEEVQN